MQSNDHPVCPRCHKPAQLAEAAFCAYCGAPMQQKKEELTDEVKKLLQQIGQEADPVKKHKLIEDGLARYPDCLELAEEKLFLGRLHERSHRKLDFSVIKSYVWHIYLIPEELDAAKIDQMRQELVAHPDLLRCLELAPDRDIYMRRYLEKLAQDFVSLFIKGSSRYNGTVFGFRLGGRADKLLATPIARMMQNIYRDQQLTSEQRDGAYDAIYRAFLLEVGGDGRWVDGLLSDLGLPIPVKM